MAFCVALTAALGCGCGRLAFDPSADDDATRSDARTDLVVDATTGPDADPALVCPGYSIQGTYPRRISTRFPGLSWQGAFDDCEATGGRLWFPQSQAHYDSLVHANGDGPFWIGYTDAVTEGAFVAPAAYVSDTPVFPWLPGEPNNSGGDEDCVTGYIEGMNDAGCGTTTPYICECDVDGQ